MRHPHSRHLQLDDHALATLPGDVLVPSRRLQRAVVADIVERARAADGRVVPLPRVRTPEELTRSLYEVLVLDGAMEPRRHLSDVATRALIEASLPNELQPHTALFESAWRLVHDYELEDEVRLFDDYEDARRFRAWAADFRAALDRRRLVTVPELPALVSRSLGRGSPTSLPRLVSIGFEHTTPAQRRLFDALSTSGTTLEHIAFGSERARSFHHVAASTAQAELRSALLWARERLRDGARIGIVVPDLAQRYDAVLRELNAVFGTLDVSAPFNISGGVPLDTIPIVADALGVLRWCNDELPREVVARILRSPFLALGVVEPTPRGARLSSAYSLTTFRNATSHRRAAELARQVATWRTMRPLGAWLHEFRRTLDVAGWPTNVRLASETYQAKAQFDSLCDELATTSSLLDDLDAGRALATLTSAAANATFAPERGSAPVQVLGYLESAGLAFSDLWVTGLDASSWPATARPHPLVPRRWQRLRGVARSTPQDEAAFCARMLEQWRRAAPTVVVSHATTSRTGEATQPSPLLAPFDALPAPIERAPSFQKALVPFDEGASSAERSSTVLTANVIRDQSVCPFRAFAIHRLGLKPSAAPSLLPTPDERGSTVHDMLELAYRSIHSREALIALSADARSSLASETARAALLGSTQRTAPRTYLVNEENRLVRILADWFEVDCARPDFVVDAVEHEQTFTIAAVPARLRLDRIDRDAATGGRIVLDYKTGIVAISQWRGERPEDPQLPLYAIAVDDARGIAFAEADTSGSRLTGIASSTDGYARSARIRVAAPTALGAASWHDLIAEWRTIIASLAAAYLNGDARVDPLHAGICNVCHLHSLCRIADRRAARVDA